jgi:hypothetical protein
LEAGDHDLAGRFFRAPPSPGACCSAATGGRDGTRALAGPAWPLRVI